MEMPVVSDAEISADEIAQYEPELFTIDEPYSNHVGPFAVGKVVEYDEITIPLPEYNPNTALATEQVNRLHVLLNRFDFGNGQRARKRQAKYLQEYLQEQSALTPQVVEVLMGADHTKLVVQNLSRFVDIDHQAIADHLIDTDAIGVLAAQLAQFQDLDEGTAWKLIVNKRDSSVRQELTSFNHELSTELAIYLIQNKAAATVVKNVDHFPTLTQNELVDTLLDTNNYAAIVHNIQSLQDVDHDDIANRIVNKGHAATCLVANNIEKFNIDDQTALAKQIITRGAAFEIGKNISKFERADRSALMHAMIDEGDDQIAYQALQTLDTSIQLDPEIAIKLVLASSPSTITHVLDKLDVFAPFDYQQIYDTLLGVGRIREAIYALPYLNGLDGDHLVSDLLADNAQFASVVTSLLEGLPVRDKVTLAKQIIDLGTADDELIDAIRDSTELQAAANTLLYHALVRPHGRTTSSWLGHFLPYCHGLNGTIGKQLIDAGCGNAVINNLGSFEQAYGTAVIHDLLLSGDVRTIVRRQQAFTGQVVDGGLVIGLLDAGKLSFSDAVKLAETLEFTNDTPIAFEIASELFGAQANEATYVACRKLEQGVISESMAALGVTYTGQRGFDQLAEILNNMRTSFIAPDTHVQGMLLQSDPLRSIFKDFVRYNESQWGRHDDASLRHLIERVMQNQKYSTLLSGYNDSEILSIPFKGRNNKEITPISEDAMQRYQRLRAILQEAIDSVLVYRIGDTPYETYVQNIRDTLQTKLGRMAIAQKKLFTSGKESQASFLGTQMGKLQTLADSGLSSFNNLEADLIQLYKESHLSDSLMVILTAQALRFDPQLDQAARRLRFERARQLSISLSDRPTDEDISKMIDLFGHEITQEAYGNMFESQQSRIAIRELFNVQSLEHALAERAKGVQSTKSARIQFIPSRGLLMELSGHIGDACWADEYPSIAEEFRNITSVLMVRHFDKHPPRMVGSMMLIETIDEKTGEEYVVIRGLNPIENFVNKTDIASFFDTVETYVNEIAMYRGKRVGLVIDTSYGRAGTNRPLLHAYMEKIKPNLRQVAVPQNSTTFNGYNISNRVYALAQSH